ncbi:uncharacterized protein LOC143032375 isoform X6 [Oratosquilla oratoria]|uniref:uncharacterized protein LOC143032375 isoform X6 n=1 Tax=Oratosquilla oratoria TaxID=337810 RepID=UPI003F760914
MFSFRTECTIVLKLPEGKSPVETPPSQGVPSPQGDPPSQAIAITQGEVPTEDTSLGAASNPQVHALDTVSATQPPSITQILPESSSASSSTSSSFVVVSSSTPAQPPSASVLFSVSPCQPPSSAMASSTSTTSSSSSHEVVVISGNTISIPLSTASVTSSPSDLATSSALTSSSVSTTESSSPDLALNSHCSSLPEAPVPSSSTSSPSLTSSSAPLTSSSSPSLPTSTSFVPSEAVERQEGADHSPTSSGVRGPSPTSPPPSPAESTPDTAISSTTSPSPTSEPLVKLSPEPSVASLETDDVEFPKGSSSVLSSATITFSNSGSPPVARPTLSMSPAMPTPVPAILSSNAINTPSHMSSPTPSSTSSPTSEISSAAFVISFPDHQISSSSDTPGVSSSSPTASTLTNNSDATPLVSPVVSPLPLDGSAPPPLPARNALNSFLNASPKAAESSSAVHTGVSSDLPAPVEVAALATSSRELLGPMSEICESVYLSPCSSLPVVPEESSNGSDSSAEGGQSPPQAPRSAEIKASGKAIDPAPEASGTPEAAVTGDEDVSHDSSSEIRDKENSLTSVVSKASVSPLPPPGLGSSSEAPPIPPKKSAAPPRPPKDAAPGDSSGTVPGPVGPSSVPSSGLLSKSGPTPSESITVPAANGEVGKITPVGNEPRRPEEVSTPSSVAPPAVLSSSSSSISTTSSTITTSTTSCFATITTTVTTKNVALPQHSSSSANSSASSPRPLSVKAEAKRATTPPAKKENAQDKGEVDSGSILETKEATKTYWEQRMQTSAAMEETGWETVANVRFQGDQENTATPPPEFIPAPPPMFDNSPEDSSAPASLDTTPQHLQQQEGPADPEAAPSKQYIYGAKEDDQEPRSARVVETVSKRNSLPKENLIEAEIREQQQKEEELRREGVLKTQQLNLLNAEKDAASTASHDSDEGFVERLVDEPPPPQAQTGRGNEGVGGMRPPYTHTITGERGEPVIYDAVSPPPQFFDRPASSTPSSSSSMHNTETKIALEIRQLREREEELRVMRERISGSRENLLEDDDSRLTSHDSRSDTLLDDHYTSLTTTTDEGNFSECGDPSSEDKSSDGSNSRIMSPEVPPQAPHADYPGRRRVVVKPFEEQEEEQPVYTRMQKESVIEREIRLAREREEAYRREKGLTHAPLVATSSNSSDKVVNRRNTTTAVMSPGSTSSGSPRDVQHRMATSRIQQEIEETSQREKELRAAGKIYTTSEETVDAKLTRGFEEKYILFERPVKARRKKYDQPPQSSGETKKVTRMSDLAEMSNRPSSSNSNISSSSTTSSSSKCLGTPVRSRSPMSPSPTPSPSPFSPPTFTTPSPVASAQPRLTRSLSTTHLASNPGGAANPMRAPKGLMQKFIASRGKMTTSAFASPPSPSSSISPTFTHRTITTRPMKVEPKVAVVRREQEARLQQAQNQQQKSQQQQYRRSYCTAEEKIQEELRDMQQREEELRRHRARQLGRSQPNLSGLILEDEDDVVDGSSSSSTKGMNGHAHLHNGDTPEVNGLRSALSNPNLLDDEQEHTQAPVERGARRRSALIAQWENRIHQTAAT